jgi:hypothetical protein
MATARLGPQYDDSFKRTSSDDELKFTFSNQKLPH